MTRLRTAAGGAALLLTAATLTSAQTPQPFPRPGAPARTAPAPAPGAQSGAPPAPQAKAAQVAQVSAPAAEDGRPADAELGLPVFPSARFLTSYDAGRGQRFYLFGTTAPFAELVAYYKTALKEKGTLVFEQPPTHTFEVGRFREETMAFPPGVTVKDYTWGGSAGYPNPKRGVAPERYPTILQIVPAPAAAAGTPRK